jgi:hypothetical protein
VWTQAELNEALADGYRDLAHTSMVFWDVRYAENRPAGFSYTQPFEAKYASVDYGYANFTQAFERDFLELEQLYGPADHTSPSDDTEGTGAPSEPSATVKLPEDTVELERVTHNQQTIEAQRAPSAQRWDSRYEVTPGRVRSYTWHKDGLYTFRKVPQPSTLSSRYTVTQTWGLLRTVTDLTDETVTGTFGIPRRIPDQPAHGHSPWGLVRRVYHETDNTRIEHYREGRAIDSGTDVYELPDHYTEGIREYALMRAYAHTGQGQDRQLSQHYAMRYSRTQARLIRRRERLSIPTMRGFGQLRQMDRTPPLPRLPWNFGR